MVFKITTFIFGNPVNHRDSLIVYKSGNLKYITGSVQAS
jgi:hypothetical protein